MFPADFLPSTSTGHSDVGVDRASVSSVTTPSTPTLSAPSLSSKSSDPHIYVIFIHPLQSGLFRIHLQHNHAQSDRQAHLTASYDSVLRYSFV